jgi:hypothetical protein
MAGATARWIAASDYAARPLIGWPDAHTAAVAAFLDRDIAMPQCGCVAPRAVFNRARDGFQRADLPGAVNRMMAAPSLLLTIVDLSPAEIAAFAGQGILVRLVTAQIAAWSDESYRVYSLDRITPPATSTPSRN